MAVLTYKKGDLEPKFVATLKNSDGSAIDLTSASSVKFIAVPVGGGTTINRAMVFENRFAGQVSWSPTSGDTATAGAYNFEIQITWTTGRWQTVPSDSFASMVIVQDIAD